MRFDAVPDRELLGTLKDISVVAKPDFTTWPPVRNFDVVVSLTDSDPRLRSGMSASARVELDRLADVLVVPTGAVFQRGSATVVYVVARGETESRPVNVLRRGRDQIAIASGVREGERIALKGRGGREMTSGASSKSLPRSVHPPRRRARWGPRVVAPRKSRSEARCD